jgi:hypothetical protein
VRRSSAGFAAPTERRGGGVCRVSGFRADPGPGHQDGAPPTWPPPLPGHRRAAATVRGPAFRGGLCVHGSKMTEVWGNRSIGRARCPLWNAWSARLDHLPLGGQGSTESPACVAGLQRLKLPRSTTPKHLGPTKTRARTRAEWPSSGYLHQNPTAGQEFGCERRDNWLHWSRPKSKLAGFAIIADGGSVDKWPQGKGWPKPLAPTGDPYGRHSQEDCGESIPGAPLTIR